MIGRTRLAVCLLVAMAFALAATPAWVDDDCTLVLLEKEAAWAETYAYDINEAGRIAGGWQTYTDGVGWDWHAVYWNKHDADPVQLPELTGFGLSWATAINKQGVISGYCFGPPYRAVTWDKKGNVTNMHPYLGYPGSQLLTLNDKGDVAGITFGPGTYRYAFVTRRGEDPAFLALDTTEYVSSSADAMNNKGVVVGNAGSIASGTTHAGFWDADGDFTSLHDELELDLGEDLYASRAWHVTNKGEIGGVGVYEDPSDGTLTVFPWVWTAEDGFDYIDADDAESAAIAGGANRCFVGVVDGSVGSWTEGQAAVWTRKMVNGATTWELSVLAGLTGYQGMIGTGANHGGAVVGNAVDANGMARAWFYRCNGSD